MTILFAALQTTTCFDRVVAILIILASDAIARLFMKISNINKVKLCHNYVNKKHFRSCDIAVEIYKILSRNIKKRKSDIFLKALIIR